MIVNEKIDAFQRYLLTTAVDHQFSGHIAAVDVQAGMLRVQGAAISRVNPGRVCNGFIGSDSKILCVKNQQIHKCQQMQQVATNKEGQSLSQQLATRQVIHCKRQQMGQNDCMMDAQHRCRIW